MANFGWSPSKGCKDAPKGHDHGHDHGHGHGHGDHDHRPVSWHHKHSSHHRHDGGKNSGGHCR
jgi:hypothetical protein